MSIAEQRREDARIASEALPEATERLRRGMDARELATWLGDRYKIDDIKAYKWAIAWEQEFDRDRRARAVRALLVAWPLAGVAAWFFASIVLPIPPAGTVTSLTVAVPVTAMCAAAFYRAATAGRRAAPGAEEKP